MIINQYIEFAQSVNLISKRTDLFRIFVELTQNISQNSTLTKEIAGKQVGCGKLTIIEYDTVFLIVAGNPANEADAKELEKRGKEINGKSQEELREYKRIKMRELIKKSENGNIGLIKTAMISNNELDIVSKKVGEDEYYVSITVKLNKD